jgi:hypothetical protein
MIANHPVLLSVTRPVNVEFARDEQSTPEKSASMVRVSALPTLSNVPVHPRGDWYSPWVLMRAGGWFDGVIALVTVVVIGNHACCDRIVTLNDCWFVPSTV